MLDPFLMAPIIVELREAQEMQKEVARHRSNERHANNRWRHLSWWEKRWGWLLRTKAVKKSRRADARAERAEASMEYYGNLAAKHSVRAFELLDRTLRVEDDTYRRIAEIMDETLGFTDLLLEFQFHFPTALPDIRGVRPSRGVVTESEIKELLVSLAHEASECAKAAQKYFDYFSRRAQDLNPRMSVIDFEFDVEWLRFEFLLAYGQSGLIEFLRINPATSWPALEVEEVYDHIDGLRQFLRQMYDRLDEQRDKMVEAIFAPYE